MKKSEILTMSSEGVFDYFYPTLCKLTNENEELRNKVKSLSEENQMLTEANDNLRDMLEEQKRTKENKRTGIKQIIIDYDKYYCIEDWVKQFLRTFNLDLVDVKVNEYTSGELDPIEVDYKEKISILITWQLSNASKDAYDFVCDAEYSKSRDCWYSDGLDVEEAEKIFGECYVDDDNGLIYFD